MNRDSFTGKNYIALQWVPNDGTWTYTPVMASNELTTTDLATLGLPSPPTTQHSPTPYSQRDDRWKAIRLGQSGYTMGGAGCAVTACAMLFSAIKPEITPGILCQWLNANGGFTTGGLLYWAKTAEYGGGKFVGYHLWRSVPADIDKLKGALAICPQVVQVDFNPGGELDSHFVLVTSIENDDAIIIDPWTGKQDTLLNLYGQTEWTLARAVYAMAEFRI